jgi:uncharacterized membrane protein
LTLYEFLLTVHILAAIVWLGGSWMLLTIGLALRAAGVQRRVEFTQSVEKLSSIYFAIASIIVIVAGSLLVDEAGYDYSDTWVILGYAGWFVSFLLGVGYYGPAGKRREKAIEEGGVESPAVLKSLNSLLAVAAFDSIVITLVVIDMTTKPGL